MRKNRASSGDDGDDGDADPRAVLTPAVIEAHTG